MFFKALHLEYLLHKKRLSGLAAAASGLAVVQCWAFYAQLYSNNFPQYRVNPSFWDQLAHCFQGIYPFVPDSLSTFQIPIPYFVWYLALLLALGGTTACGFTPYGYEVFTRLPHRSVWWLARCTWAAGAAVLQWAAALAAAAGFCAAVGAPFGLGAYQALALPQIQPWPGPGGEQLKTLLLAPLLAGIATALVQLLLELALGSVPALLGSLALVVAGAFLNEPVLFCSHAMMLRMAVFTGEGAALQQTAIYTLAAAAFCVAAGMVLLPRKDLLNR